MRHFWDLVNKSCKVADTTELCPLINSHLKYQIIIRNDTTFCCSLSYVFHKYFLVGALAEKCCTNAVIGFVASICPLKFQSGQLYLHLRTHSSLGKNRILHADLHAVQREIISTALSEKRRASNTI